MRAGSIASLALKLLGIYALLLAMGQTPMLISLVGNVRTLSVQSPWVAPGMCAPFLLLAAAGTALISLSGRLASLLVDEEDAQCRWTVSITEVQAVGFSVVGVMVLSGAIPKLFQICTNISLLRAGGLGDMTERTTAGVWSNVVGLVVQFTIGFGLFFNARGLTHLWQRLQNTRPMK